MKRFESVLVLTNAERPLAEKLTAARNLAVHNDARLTLFDVIEQHPARWWALERGGPDIVDELIEERAEQLRGYADELDVPDVDVRVVEGSATYIEVVREVAEQGHDIVITAPDEPGRRRLAGAATTMHLLRKCPVPVWVNAARRAGQRGVLASVGPFFPEMEQLNRTVLELASSLAAREEEPLHIIHVWRLPGESMLRAGRAQMPADQVDAMAARAEDEARAGLAALIDSVPDAATGAVHVVKGMPGEVIPRFIERENPRTLAIGTLARTGVRGMIIGNTAERVFGVIDCSVLAVKPPGFVSPVLE